MDKEILNCLTYMVNEVAHTVQYESWSDEYCRKNLKKATDKMLEVLKKHIDWDNLTKQEAEELRFMAWDKEKFPDLYLIPLYLLPILPIGMELTTIFGEKIIYDGKNVDKDTRQGMLACGIHIKN